MITAVVRLVLTVLLLIGVYFETGVFTTISLAFIFIAIELLSVVLSSKFGGNPPTK